MVRHMSPVLGAAPLGCVGAVGAGEDGKKTEEVFKKTENGSPKIESIDAITFGPNGALLIGDSKGGQVVAIDTKDTKAKPWKAAAIEKFNEKIAAKLGTKGDKI